MRSGLFDWNIHFNGLICFRRHFVLIKVECQFLVTNGPFPFLWIFDVLMKRMRSEEHTSELQSRFELVCRLLLEKKNPDVKRSVSHVYMLATHYAALVV